MELQNNQFWTVNYNDEFKALEFWWKDTTNMLMEDFKRLLLFAAESSEIHHPKSLFIDIRRFEFTVIPELQIWTNENVFTRYKEAGLEQFVYVVSEDLFAQVSVEQIMEEEEGQSFASHYFASVEEAQVFMKESMKTD